MTLWAVKAGDRFNLDYFNHGDYLKAVERQEADETISKVLYPGDSTVVGKELRLKQQYFFASASLQEILQEFLRDHKDFALLPPEGGHSAERYPPLHCHPRTDAPSGGCSSSELGERLGDYHQHLRLHQSYASARGNWRSGTWGFWGNLLPRHLEILYEINGRFLDMVSKSVPHDVDLLRRLSIFEEGERKRVRMAHLAVVGSHSVNGVAALQYPVVERRLTA